MNDTHDHTANAAGKKPRRSSAALALIVVVGLALLLPSAAALASVIPGIDIIVQKKPGGIAVTLPSDPSGNFSLRLTERGNYTISTACRQPGGCLPHKLSAEMKPGADGEPSVIAILAALLVPTQKASADGTTFDFTVGDRGVVLSGQVGVVPDLPGERAAPGLPSPSSQAGIAKAGEAPLPDYLPGKAAPKKASPRDTTPPPPRYVEWQPYAMGTAPPPPESGGDELPGLAGEPIPGIDVKLGKNPGGSIVASSQTDSQGNFHFDKLPAGNYTLKLPGLSEQSFTVGAEGKVGGTLMRGPGDSFRIFDRWGNLTTKEQDDVITVKGKTAEKPGSFGSGTGPDTGPSGGMGGAGMNPGMIPGAGGPMGGPTGPSPGGPGGPMRP